ncbi:MAG: hypothetical protein IJ087_16485 [Eggerthellaceae bacterium]|nr:hypothetical protein [Eggerthellaceae bacterium]
MVDRSAIRALARETRHWGYQYDQVVKALNTIALCLRRVSVDGETVLVRILDELVDAQTLEYESEMITYYTPRLVNFYDYYLKVLGRKDSPEIDTEACAKLAVSPETMAGLLERDELTRPDEDEMLEKIRKSLW